MIRLAAIGGVGLALVSGGVPLSPLRTPFVVLPAIRMGHANVAAIVFSRRLVAPLLFLASQQVVLFQPIAFLVGVCLLWGDVHFGGRG